MHANLRMVGLAAARGIEIPSGLPLNSSRNLLRHLFEPFGPVDACWLKSKEDDGNLVGYVRFQFIASAKAATTACEKQEFRDKGLTLQCKYSDQSELPSPQKSVEQGTQQSGRDSGEARARSRSRKSRTRRKEDKRKKTRARSSSGSGSSSSSSSPSSRGRERATAVPTPRAPASSQQPAAQAPTKHVPPPPPPAPSAARAAAGANPNARVPKPAALDSKRASSPPVAARDVKRTSLPAASKPSAAPAASSAALLEIRNVPRAGESGITSPEELLVEMLNPTLEILPQYDRAKGSAVVRTWTHSPNVCRMELQSMLLCESAARVLQGLAFCNRTLETKVID